MKKILTKAVAALVSAVTLSSMVGAIPTSAIDMSYGVGKNSAMQYTVYTTKVSDTEVMLHVKVLNNPGIGFVSFVVKNDNAITSFSDDEHFDHTLKGGSFTYVYNDEQDQAYVSYANHINPNRKQFEFSIIYEIDKNDKNTHDFQIGVTAYRCPSEPDACFDYSSVDGLKSSDAVISVTPSVNVLLGDINNDKVINSTDLYYIEKILSDSVGGQLSTTYLDEQLKNHNSFWSKNYPFLKCAAVADIDHNTMIQDTDSDSLAKYVAEAGAGATISNKEINTLLPVTVVYDN